MPWYPRDSQGALSSRRCLRRPSGIHGSVDGGGGGNWNFPAGGVRCRWRSWKQLRYPDNCRSMAIRYRSPDSGATDYLWLDAASAEAGGKPWRTPTADAAVRYVAALLEETRQMGFADAALQGVQFPGQVSSKRSSGSPGTPRDEQLVVDRRLADAGGQSDLWLSILVQCTDSPSSLGAPGGSWHAAAAGPSACGQRTGPPGWGRAGRQPGAQGGGACDAPGLMENTAGRGCGSQGPACTWVPAHRAPYGSDTNTRSRFVPAQ